MKNKGLHQYRFAGNPSERRFAEAWEKANSHAVSIDTIDYILSADNNRPVSCSDRDREVAATVIQWLGSPCGQEFLRSRSAEADEPVIHTSPETLAHNRALLDHAWGQKTEGENNT